MIFSKLKLKGCLLAIILLIVTASSHGIDLYLYPHNYQATIRDTIVIDVNVSHVQDCFAFAADVIFDHRIVTLISVTEGDFLNESGNVQTFFMRDIDNMNGSSTIGITRMTNPPSGATAETDTTLLRLMFRTQHPGNPRIRLHNTGLIAPNGVTNYDHTVINGNYSVIIPPDHSRLFFSPSSVSVEPEERFETRVMIDRVTDLFAVSVDINYDNQQFQIVDVDEGDFLNQNGDIPTSLIYDDNERLGILTVGITQLGIQQGASTITPEPLFAVNFESISTANDTIYINNIGLIAPDGETTYPGMGEDLHVNALPLIDGEITGLRAIQRDSDCKKVDIYYNLENDEPATILLHVSNDNGESWDMSCNLVTGDIGENISPGRGKHIVWDVLAEHPNISGDQFRFKLTAVASP